MALLNTLSLTHLPQRGLARLHSRGLWKVCEPKAGAEALPEEVFDNCSVFGMAGLKHFVTLGAVNHLYGEKPTPF